DKKIFHIDLLNYDLSLLCYELASDEIENPSLVLNLLRKKIKLVLVAEEISLDRAIEFIRMGVRDIKLLSSPLDLLEKSLILFLEEERDYEREEQFITCEPPLLKILSALDEVAKTKAPVLLIGESGTGKELLARYIHEKSPRQGNPFIAINCAALPETLLESELFGYEKGAFSGANFRKKGKLELAHQGTLFLDEIAEMNPSLQSKLLRVLQEGEVDRLGGYHPIKVDFRLISATNRDIEKEVKENRFRSDLYYRINVITVKIPPLRERRNDVKLLAQYYLEKFSKAYRKKFKGFSQGVVDFLMKYPFPGNVRELKNMVERAVILCKEDYIDVNYLTNPFENLTSSGLVTPINSLVDEVKIFTKNGINFEYHSEEIKTLEEMEREAILKALQLTKGNKSKAAELLGITVRTLRNKLTEYKERGLISLGEV
ncbi:MAG: sigma-54 dependent transcriptional regulator, partial [Thermodesulfobacteriaceae bacterium]|nr:sigma-54 dependent transcriptional regulator [Thermodesulfobacteriaceae bacterium]